MTTSSLEALKVFSVAREVYTSARIDEAVTLFEEALRLDPSFAGARAQLGMIHFQLRDRKKGTELLAQTIQSVNELTEKERYGLLAFHAMAVENNPQKAADYYKTLLALYPDTWAPYNNLGRAYMQMGRWNEAVDALTRALRIEPDVMLTYNSLSEIYLYYLGDPNAAAALCRQQITYNSAHGLAYDRLGWALLGIGDFAQAREAFQKALVIDPHATIDLFRLGHTYRLERRYKDAYETFLRIPAIKPSPDSARYTTQRAAHYDAGVAAHLMGDTRTAQSHFATYRQLVEKEIRENRQNGDLYLELAAVLSRLGEDAEATSAAARGTTLAPDSHFQYATVLSLQRKYSEAIDRLQLAIDGGFRNFVWMKIHPDFEPLAYEPRFQAILAARMKT